MFSNKISLTFFLGVVKVSQINPLYIFSIYKTIIKDRIWKKINSWSSKSLSKASCEILIKFVLRSITTYFTSLFTLLVSLCDEIEIMMNFFWWGYSGDQSIGINRLYWDTLYMHKNDRGMSFKNLPIFNLAMLDKQGWRLVSNSDSLATKIYKERYYPKFNFFVWRSWKQMENI